MKFLSRSFVFVFMLFVLAASLNAAPPNAVAPLRIHGGTVVIKSKQHATIFLVRNGDGNGPAEHLFQVWSNPGLSIDTTYRGADVEYTGTSLAIVVPASQTAFTFTVSGSKPPAIPIPEGFSTTTYGVLGLSHLLGQAVARYPIHVTSGRIAALECTDCDWLPFEDPWGASGGSIEGCTSGGLFAISCSQSGANGSCSVSCGGNSHACCKAGDPPSCSCLSN
jgi:hypothetical protein